MRAGQLPLDEQMTRFRQALGLNRTLGTVLTGAAAMNLPGWYLVAGCLYQTVWNVITGQPPEAGILDYDLVYFDASDLSWGAEDAVIRAGNEVFAGLAAPVQIRNQARVHLWYEQKFGLPCPPHASSEAAIDTYEATVASLGVRLESGGRWRIYAPYGLSDVFNLVARPNPVLATRDVYETKTARWQGQWPGLTVLPWRVLPAIAGRATAMAENDDRSSRRGRRLREAGAWAGAVSAVMTRYAFLARRVDQTAALLALPEVAWTAFATALSAAIAAKNVALGRRLDTSSQEGYRVKKFKRGRIRLHRRRRRNGRVGARRSPERGSRHHGSAARGRQHPAAARDERAARVAGADGIGRRLGIRDHPAG
jgi:hypothetical protein